MKEQEYSLNPGRYVGVVIEEDGKTEEEFIEEMLAMNDELDKLNTEARELEAVIGKNIRLMRGKSRRETHGFLVTIRRKPELAFEAVGGITGEVRRLLTVFVGEMKRKAIQEVLVLRQAIKFTANRLTYCH